MTTSEEAPLNFEREPPKFCETTLEVGKDILRLDGMLTRVLEKLKMAMRPPDRGPDPDVPSEDDERILIPVRLLDRLGNYQEAPKAPPESNLKAIVIGCTITIVSAGIIGAIVLSNQFSALRAEFSEWKTATEHRLQQLERRP